MSGCPVLFKMLQDALVFNCLQMSSVFINFLQAPYFQSLPSSMQIFFHVQGSIKCHQRLMLRRLKYFPASTGTSESLLCSVRPFTVAEVFITQLVMNCSLPQNESLYFLLAVQYLKENDNLWSRGSGPFILYLFNSFWLNKPNLSNFACVF